MESVTFFWGCQIPARFPFMEKSVRILMDRLGIKIVDIPGFTCCPEKALVKNLDQKIWYLTAARNLAVAEDAGVEVLIEPCNGCYSTLKAVKTSLNLNLSLKNEINRKLQTFSLEYRGHIQVMHLAEYLHDKVGLAKLKENIVDPLSGMDIAVHYGCHMIRPSYAIQFDDPILPKKFDALVTALGARSVEYSRKMQCCGGEYSNVGSMEEALIMAREKLLEVKNLSIDALVVMCPACFMQFDNKQYMMHRQGEDLAIPIFFFPELVCLTYGIQPEELGLAFHRIDTRSFWERRHIESERIKKIEEAFDLDSLERCYQCQACLDDCPGCLNFPDFQPDQIMGKILEGKAEELLNTQDIWHCLECHTCYELCPQRYGMETVFTTLKGMAMDKGLIPATVKQAIETFEKSGKLGEPQKSQRKKLDLPEPPASGVKEWKEIVTKK
jgi:CoB--CoM heterodisulfide reductase subunit B